MTHFEREGYDKCLKEVMKKGRHFRFLRDDSIILFDSYLTTEFLNIFKILLLFSDKIKQGECIFLLTNRFTIFKRAAIS